MVFRVPGSRVAGRVGRRDRRHRRTERRRQDHHRRGRRRVAASDVGHGPGGRAPGRDPALRTVVGVQLQSSSLPDKTRVREALDLYASFYPSPTPGLLAQMGLAEVADRPFGKLSGGQKQRLSIALALVGSPRVAILDELTTGLDPAARRDAWRLVASIRDRGIAVLLVTHYMDESERLCDRLVVIDGSRVVATGTPADPRGDAPTLEDAYVTLTSGE